MPLARVAPFADVATDVAIAAATATSVVAATVDVAIVTLLCKLPLLFLLLTVVAIDQLPPMLGVVAVAASVAASTAMIPAPEVVESIAIIDRQNWLREAIKTSYRSLRFIRYSSHDN